MGTPNGWLFDIEADGLYLQSTKIWYIRLTSLDGSRTLCVKPFEIGNEKAKELIMSWVTSFKDGHLVVSHNGLGYDLWMLWKILGITPRVGKGGKDFLGGKHVQYIDTFVLSMYLHPNQQSHSLAFLSSGNDNTKMEYRQQLIELGAMKEDDAKSHEFSFYHPLMDEYCDTDVLALKDVFSYLWRCGEQMYGEEWLHPSFRQMQKDYWLFSAQAFTGVKFDIEAAKSLITTIDNEMLILKNEVDPLLPPRELKGTELAFYKMPAKPFTTSGEMSATLNKWLLKIDAELIDGIVYAKGISAPLIANSVFPVKLPMEISDNTELKDFFIKNGWTPSDDHWNFKKDSNNKPLRDERGRLIKTTPKIQHQGNICPNLLKIEGEIPSKIVKYLSLRNRKGVVEGWLKNWRLDFDGRLSAEISGYAPTSRVKHKVVVNCPKADVKVLLGAEMRSLFCVDYGNWYIGTDAAALENRTLSHYTYKYDNGFFADLNLNGDIHCYSEDTEILTNGGWKTFGEITIDSEVAQWDDGIISFVKPSSVIWQDYTGEMISVKNKKIDFLVTPEHRVVYKRYKGTGNVKVKLAKDLSNKDSSIRFPVAGLVENGGIPLSLNEIRLVVAIQADGSFDNKLVRFEFKKERKVERLINLLTSIGISYSERCNDKRETKRFSVSKCNVENILSYLTKEKEFNNKLLKMSVEQSLAFLEEVKYWDGTVTKNGDTILDTTDKVSRDIIATVGALCGRNICCTEYIKKKGDYGICNIFRAYIPRGSKQYVAPLASKIETVQYKGKVGCVSVPSTFVVVRRNKKIIVSGNTSNAFAFFPHLEEIFNRNDTTLNENPLFKPWRNKAKTGAYLLAFGGGAVKLASSLGLSKKEGEQAYNNYWETNVGLGKLKEHVEKYFATEGKMRFIPAIDGRLVSVRGKNVLLSCLGQGLGAIVMSYASCIIDNYLGELHIDSLGRPFYLYKGKKVKRVSHFHDEYSWEVENGIQDDILSITENAIVKAGEILNLSIPLAAKGKAAYNGTWCDVH